MCSIAIATLAATTATTACSGGGGSDGTSDDSKSTTGTASASPAPPGKFSSLPEPCGTISTASLRGLVPDAQDYAGVPTLTYDTDRRVGCKWTGSTDEGNRYLHIDFERVVSYDPLVSDEDEAAEDYTVAALDADIPDATASATDSPRASASPSGSGTAETEAQAEASPSAGSASATPSASDSLSTSASADLSSRLLSSLGDAAFIDDELVTADSGVHRDISVVFRIANVLVTIEYSQWSTDKAVTPESADLQSGARQVAEELATEFDE